MKKKTIAALLALLTSASLFGCGDPFAEAMLKDVPAYEFSSSEAETAKLTEAENSAVSAESENAAEESESAEESSDAADEAEAASELEPGSEEELAEVLRVTRAYEDAIYDQDMEALLDCTDMDLLYYIKNNEVGSREDLIAFEEEAFGDKLSKSLEQNPERVSVFKDPVYVPEKAEEYNTVLKKMGAISNVYHIDSVYLYRFQNQAAADAGGQAGSGLQFSMGMGDLAFGMDVAVVRINGEWKFDMGLPMFVSYWNELEKAHAAQ